MFQIERTSSFKSHASEEKPDTGRWSQPPDASFRSVTMAEGVMMTSLHVISDDQGMMTS